MQFNTVHSLVLCGASAFNWTQSGVDVSVHLYLPTDIHTPKGTVCTQTKTHRAARGEFKVEVEIVGSVFNVKLKRSEVYFFVILLFLSTFGFLKQSIISK